MHKRKVIIPVLTILVPLVCVFSFGFLTTPFTQFNIEATASRILNQNFYFHRELSGIENYNVLNTAYPAYSDGNSFTRNVPIGVWEVGDGWITPAVPKNITLTRGYHFVFSVWGAGNGNATLFFKFYAYRNNVEHFLFKSNPSDQLVTSPTEMIWQHRIKEVTLQVKEGDRLVLRLFIDVTVAGTFGLGYDCTQYPSYVNDPPDTATFYPDSYSLLGSTTYVSGALSDLQSDNGVYMTFRSYASAFSPNTITFRAAGAKASGTTSAVTPALPTGVAIGDICILVATTLAGGSISITVNGGGAWTALTGSPIDVTGGEKLYVWWRRHASGDSAPSVKAGTDHICAGIAAWYNCITSGSPIDVSQTGTETTSDTTFSFATTISTTVNGAMCLAICSTGADATAAQFTVMTNAQLTSLAERMDYCTNFGGGGGFALDQGYKATTGAVGTWASTLTTASPKAYISFALKPSLSVSEYTCEVEFTALSNVYPWSELVWTIDSSFTTTGVTATFQLYNYQTSEYPTSGDGYMTDTIGTTDVTKTQTITEYPANFKDVDSSWKMKIKGVKFTNTQFDWKGDLTSLNITYTLTSETRYMRSDQQEVNGLIAYILGTAQTASEWWARYPTYVNPQWGVRVWIRHINESETERTSGTPVAVVTRNVVGSGMQSADWECLEYPLASTDAVVVRVYIWAQYGAWYLAGEFITEALGASQLDNVTWKVYYWTQLWYNGFLGYYEAIFNWGTSTSNSRIENFSCTVAVGDEEKPTYSDISINTTEMGTPCLFSVKWADNVNMSGYIYGSNNTETWLNDTWVEWSPSGSPEWSNVTKTLNSNIAKRVEWCVWANDTSDNWNNTGIQILYTSIYIEPVVQSTVDRRSAHGYTYYDGFLYACHYYQHPYGGQISKINASDYSDYINVTIDEFVSFNDIMEAEGRIWVCSGSGYLYEVNASTLSVISSVQLFASSSEKICYDGTYIFASGANGSVAKYKLSDASHSSNQIAINKTFHSLVESGDYLYVSDVMDSVIRKVYKNDLTQHSVSGTMFGQLTDDMAQDSTYVYGGVELSDIGGVVRITKSDLTVLNRTVDTMSDSYGVFIVNNMLLSLDEGNNIIWGFEIPSLEIVRVVTLKNLTYPLNGINELAVEDNYVHLTQWYGVCTPIIKLHLMNVTGTAGYDLNLCVMDYDLADAIADAYVYIKNATGSYVQTSDVNGWANWTAVSGTVYINASYYGFWVNGTFSVTVNSDTTINVRCNLYDVNVKVIPETDGMVLISANVTVYNSTSVPANQIRTAKTEATGIARLVNLPNYTLTFTVYDGVGNVLANTTLTMTVDEQNETITITQNYALIKLPTIYIISYGALIIANRKKKEKGVKNNK